jgi:hypothetical protein
MMVMVRKKEAGRTIGASAYSVGVPTPINYGFGMVWIG